MAYDPTKPANGAPIVSAELRDQFTALNDGIGSVVSQLGNLPTKDEMTDAINVTSAKNVDGMDNLDLTVSNPPTSGEVQQLADKLHELITALKRT